MFWCSIELVSDHAEIKTRYGVLRPLLDERARRLVVAAESQTAGRGGISAVSRATGVSRQVIRQGIAEVERTYGYGAKPDSAPRWWAKKSRRLGPITQEGSGEIIGVDDAGRSRISPAVDMQERSQLDSRIETNESCREPSSSGGFAARVRI